MLIRLSTDQSTAAGDDDVAAVDLGGVAPDVVLPGQLEGQLVVLAVVPAHIDGKTVGAFKAPGGKLAGFHPLPVGVHTDIAAGIELLTDLFQLCVLLGPGRARPAPSRDSPASR